MKKLIVLSVFLFGFALALNIALAQEEASQEATSASAEAEVTAADLGVEDPGILPTSRVYFLKNWQRTIKRTFTFNPVKKAALELDIANQQAAEIAEMKEVAPDRVDAIAKASQNYQDNVDRLKTRLEALKETSQNPNVNKLMENLADRSVKHQQLFDELKQKFADNPELKQRAEEMQNKMQDALIKIPEKFDSQEAFKERMQRAIEAGPESQFKELRGMEMMEKITEKLPENRRAGFDGVKNDLMEKFENRVNAMSADEQKTFMAPHVLERMPGDSALRVKILGEAQERGMMPPEMVKQIEMTQGQILEKAVEKGEITKEKTEEQIRRAEKAIAELESAINDPGTHISEITRMKSALTQAKKHLDSAKSALSAGKYGEAFGQATTAEAIARNSLSGETRPLPAVPPPAVPPTGGTGVVNPPTVCTQEYKPVCGINGKTYSNACHAKVAGVAIKVLGVCQSVPVDSIETTGTAPASQ